MSPRGKKHKKYFVEFLLQKSSKLCFRKLENETFYKKLLQTFFYRQKLYFPMQS